MSEFMNLSEDMARGIASVERDMDSGKQPFVIYNGGRWAVTAGAIDALGLTCGQTVSAAMIDEILKFNISSIKTAILMEKLKAKS